MNYRKFGLMVVTAALATTMACGIEDDSFGAEGRATVGAEPTAEVTFGPTFEPTPDITATAAAWARERFAINEHVEMRLSVSHLPRVNEPFTVTGTFTAREQLDDVEVWVSSAGGVYLDGEDRWHGPLSAGEEVTLTATFAVVSEGNHTAGASAYTQIGGADGTWIAFNSDSESGKSGFTDIDDCCSPVFGADDPPGVSAPTASLIETSLALNQSTVPRVELVATEADLDRLQSDGLLPEDLRNQWTHFRLNVLYNPHLFFHVVYYGPLSPTPGCIVERSEDDFLPWNDGNLQVSLITTCVPDAVPRADKPTSPVIVLQFPRRDHLYGPPDDPPAYEGNEFTIELIVDNASAGQVTIDLRGEAAGR